MKKRKTIIFSIATVILIGLALSFWKPYLKIDVQVKDKKESYELGDSMILAIKIRNYFFLPFSLTFSSTCTEPYLSVDGIDQMRFVVACGDAFTTVTIPPFGRKMYSEKINLVNEETAMAYLQNPEDIIFGPGKNRIIAEWGGRKGETEIDIDPNDFYEAEIPCESFDDLEKQDRCYNNILLEKGGSVEFCGKFPLSEVSCLIHIAKEKQDESICDEIETEKSRDYCIEEVYLEKKDVKLCEILKDPSHCYRFHAKETRDSSYCDLVPNSEVRKRCYNELEE